VEVGVTGVSTQTRPLRTLKPQKALPELDISGIMGVPLENALQRSSIKGSDQADVDGLTEEISA
jgi:hypothetical protein